MGHAWLDSLSEDWVSQAGSVHSQIVSVESRTTSGTVPNSKPGSDRFDSLRRVPSGSPNSSNVLSERSTNEVNIFGSRRSPSKLSQELMAQERGPSLHRAVSSSTMGSVVHNTVARSCQSTSPEKNKGETPEWKRRLVLGEVGYGEQRDLFSSAKLGLENMFQPPSPAPVSTSAPMHEEDEEEDDFAVPEDHQPEYTYGDESEVVDGQSQQHFAQDSLAPDMTMPSSPPVRMNRYDISIDPFSDQSSFGMDLPHQPHRLSVVDEIPSSDEEDQPQHEDAQQAKEESDGQMGSQIHHEIASHTSRVISGQSVLRNESFSAIMVSPEKDRHADGAVFGQVELPSGELKRRLENLRWKHMALADDIDGNLAGRSVSIGGKSLNVDNTEDYEKMGGFINFRRGGRSSDGSFRDNMLSPPLGPDTSEMLPEESLQASTPKQFPTVRTQPPTLDSRHSPHIPRAPHPSPEKQTLEAAAAPPVPAHVVVSGSPLKLFGPYDTFTNQTLMRRISQFEDQMTNASRASSGRSEGREDGEETRAEMEGDFDISPERLRELPQGQMSRHGSAQFGAGELDGYEFDDDISGLSPEASRHESDYANIGVPQHPFRSAHQSGLHIKRLRHNNSNTLDSFHDTKDRPTTAERPEAGDLTAATPVGFPSLATPSRAMHVVSTEKRQRTSPSKDPTPKRRRTLHESDIAFGSELLPQDTIVSVQASHYTMQSIMGRKHSDDDTEAASKTHRLEHGPLNGMDSSRPRTPTPSQRSSVQREQNLKVEGADRRPSNTENRSSMGGNGHRLRSSGLRSEASFTGRPVPAGGAVMDGERKPSIRTEDFMNEAQRILAMIRGRGMGIRSGLTSLEESEMESPATVAAPSPETEDSDGSFQESTKEPFSRPPSREGRPIPRMPLRQENPELLAKLKKYEERSDLDDLVTLTTRSISMAQEAIRREQEATQAAQSVLGTARGRTRLDEGEYISDHPNIRISMKPERWQEEPGEELGSLRDSMGSQASAASGSSTGRSIPTASSRGSDTRRTIAPETVSHLIPDQVGNMVLDRDRNIWIRKRSGSVAPPIHMVLPSEGSEEDPFADIPDLSVDVTMEMHNLKAGATPGPVRFTRIASAAAPAPTLAAAPAPVPTIAPSTTSPMETWDADVTEYEQDKVADKEGNQADGGEVVEHEISINESRISQTGTAKRRHLAISFSSPIASIIQDFVMQDEGSGHGAAPPMGGQVTVEDELADDLSTLSLRRGRRTVSVNFKSTGPDSGRGATKASRSVSRGPAWQVSMGGEAFVPRPVSRIEEREEEELRAPMAGVPGASAKRNRELSLVGDGSSSGEIGEIRTPVPRQTSFKVAGTPAGRRDGRAMVPAADDEEVMAQYVGMLSLSPMSEFTIHHERSLAMEASYVVGSRHVVTGDGSKTVMSQSLQSLVGRLAEVEPYEPYWEDLEELDVREQRLVSLHKLDEFCPQLVTLDATSNGLQHLGGIPASVRHLKIVHNGLSELTSWSRLANLQHLDVSNNAIKTLSGLRNLVHLRTLKADHCGLTDLASLQQHDGLQILRARGNGIQAVDFTGTRMQKLVELDLEDNEVATVRGLGQLGALTTLNLRRNRLAEFSTAEGLAHVRSLNLSDNRLETLDVRGLPSLRQLFADRNRLTRIRGFSKTPRLDSVSLREQAQEQEPQQEPRRLDISSLYRAYEIRKLYLSGNYLGRFEPPVDFLNLQLLELANCGLTELPADFGRAVPNLRKLNVNFNGLADLGSLRGIPRLKKVLAAGNRLAYAYSTVRVLAEFEHLAEVDLRDNPLTQGFYVQAAAVAAEAAGQTVASTSALTTPSTLATPPTPTPEPFTVPLGDVERDRAYCGRLDLATAMRRRVYEQVVGKVCRKLKQRDGLPVNRSVGELRDEVWEALKARGIVAGEAPEEKQEKAAAVVEETRWGAEDSFA